MKNENKLQAVVNFMNWIENQPNHNDVTMWAKESRKLIQEFLVDNMAKSKATYDINDFTANDEIRPILNGICYDPATKSAVATDAHLLVVDRAKYDQSIVDKFADRLDGNGRVTVDKYGNLIEGKYPNYLAVFPKYTTPVDHTIDLNDLQDYIKRCKAWLKANGYKGPNNYSFIYQVGETYFEAKMLLSFAIATDGKITVDANDFHRHGSWRGEERDALICCLYRKADDTTEYLGKEEGLRINYRN